MRRYVFLAILCASPAGRADTSVDPARPAAPAVTQAQPDLLLRRALLYLQEAEHYAAISTEDARKKSEQWRLAGIK